MKGRGENLGWTLAFELAPAAIFGGSAAFAASKALAPPPADPTVPGIGIGAFCVAWLFLRLFRGRSDAYVMPVFDLGAFDGALAAVAEASAGEPQGLDQSAPESHAEQVPAEGSVEDELILEDVLAAIDPAARVVQLFRANDTAGELHARIERHLRETPRPSDPPDATQELHEAIAALRRSLR